MQAMTSQASSTASNTPGTGVAADAGGSDIAAVVEQNTVLRQQVDDLSQQLATLKKLLFGARSEKRIIDIPGQHELFGREVTGAQATPPTTVPEHTRGRAKKGFPDGCVNGEGLRFGPDVPVTTVRLEPEGIQGLSPEDHEVIGVETRHKLAQQASSYTVLRYEQPVIKLKQSGQILPVVPVASVLERSLADVSLLAGLLSDKFVSHLPLHRQHQRMEAAGITVSRATLTNLVRRSIDLLAPIADAQWQHILASKVLAMDETPIKAGKSKTRKGRMHQGYFWPIFGEDNEIVFTYAGSRARHVIERILTEQFRGTLLSDGYAAYASYCRGNTDIVHAQCWAHARRKFIEAQEAEPVLADRMLELIGVLYRVERDIREADLGAADTLARRQRLSRAVVDEIFALVDEQRADPSLLPSNPFSKALQYLSNRPAELRVFLDDPQVPIDTCSESHSSRARTAFIGDSGPHSVTLPAPPEPHYVRTKPRSMTLDRTHRRETTFSTTTLTGSRPGMSCHIDLRAISVTNGLKP